MRDREFIYFAQGRTTGHIKIGWTKDLWNRLAAIQAHSGDYIDLRAHIVGTRLLQHEKRLHEQFKAAKLHGEWFSPVPELLAGIDGLRGLRTPAELAHYDAMQTIWIMDPVRICEPSRSRKRPNLHPSNV